MTHIEFAPHFFSDLKRLTNFLLDRHPEDAVGLTDLILDGLLMLQLHPQVGRPYKLPMRELIISRGRSGYLALYRYNPITDEVLVMRIRHQRESGYSMIE
jgi:plasmid stabilization system protein ParE